MSHTGSLTKTDLPLRILEVSGQHAGRMDVWWGLLSYRWLLAVAPPPCERQGNSQGPLVLLLFLSLLPTSSSLPLPLSLAPFLLSSLSFSPYFGTEYWAQSPMQLNSLPLSYIPSWGSHFSKSQTVTFLSHKLHSQRLCSWPKHLAKAMIPNVPSSWCIKRWTHNHLLCWFDSLLAFLLLPSLWGKWCWWQPPLVFSHVMRCLFHCYSQQPSSKINSSTEHFQSKANRHVKQNDHYAVDGTQWMATQLRERNQE